MKMDSLHPVPNKIRHLSFQGPDGETFISPSAPDLGILIISKPLRQKLQKLGWHFNPTHPLPSHSSSLHLFKSAPSLKHRSPGRKQRNIIVDGGQTEDYVEGLANGRLVHAFPDTGAESCSLSTAFAAELGLEPAPGTGRTFKLPNGKDIRSPGMVRLIWSFYPEQKELALPCWIVPGNVHQLIIGNSFMRTTQTLTRFAQRIKTKAVDAYKRLRVRLLGDTKHRLRGSVNGLETMAVADTGSDVMLMSGDYARKCGLLIEQIVNDHEKSGVVDDSNDWTYDCPITGCVELEFMDGTTEWTDGIVRNVPWEISGKITYQDFYILESLCEEVILSKDYLAEVNAFVEHEDSFFDTSSEDDVSRLCLIRLIGRFSNKLNLLEEEYMHDITSPGVFSHEMVQTELARRDLIRDEIDDLPPGTKEAARQAEAERQQRWQRLREAHRKDWLDSIPVENSTHGESGESSRKATPAGVEDNATPVKNGDENRRKIGGSKVSVLSRWLRRKE